MKILHVITSLHTGGAEKLMVDLLPRFRAAGHDVDLLVFDGADTPFKESLRQKDIRIFELGRPRSVYRPDNILRLRPYLDTYDIVHTHNTACQYYVAAAQRLFGGRAKLVTTEHNTDNRRRRLPGFRHLDGWMYRRYARIVCISDQTEANLRRHAGDLATIRTIPNGVDTRCFRDASPCDRRTLGIPPEARLVVQIAAFRPQKDQKTLIRAISLLPENYHALFVGDGVCRSECEALAATSDAASRIRFAGIRTDVPQLLKTADLVVMSSHWEGFGLAAVEGMAAHKPVLATDVPGLREVVEGAGVLFEHENPQQLADSIRRLTDDPALYAETADRCAARAAKYDIAKMADAYLQTYLSL